MSRIGNRILKIPPGVEVAMEGRAIRVKGPLGELEVRLPKDAGALRFAVDGGAIAIARANELKQTKMLHGTYNALLKNALTGVTVGFTKQLQLVGVGYRAALKNPSTLNLALGYSHPIDMQIPKTLKVTVEKNTLISITGPDRQLVGAFAVEVRKWRPPEPYKGKGVLYAGEQIIRKAGKTAEGKK